MKFNKKNSILLLYLYDQISPENKQRDKLFKKSDMLSALLRRYCVFVVLRSVVDGLVEREVGKRKWILECYLLFGLIKGCLVCILKVYLKRIWMLYGKVAPIAAESGG